MELFNFLQFAAILFGIFGILSFIFIRRKFLKELEKSKNHEEELSRKVYEIKVLKEIGERVGYSLDALKIVEIISGSVGKLLPYSTISYMVYAENEDKVIFSCKVNETISGHFIRDVKVKMIAAFSQIAQRAIFESDLDESISGVILDDNAPGKVESYFNLPIVISGRPVGIINVASFRDHNLYKDENTEVLFRIAKQSSQAVSKLQELLDTEKARLSQAVQSLSDGVLMVDTKFRLVLVNKKVTEFLGLLSNPSLFDIVNALSGHLDIRTKMEEAFTKDEPLAPQEITVKGKILQVIVSKVMDRVNRNPIGIVVLFRDISEAKSIEKLRRDFMAMMVHELRAPLTSIKSTVELMLEDPGKVTPDDLKKQLTIVDSTSYTMLGVVNDLLDVAKLEAGKFEVVRERGDVGETVLERVESIRAQAALKNLKITVDVEKDLPEGYFDKIRIRQVLNNILSNAIKFTENGEVKVKVSKETVGGKPVDILVAISDTGIGIEPDQIGTLFSKFAQLKAGRRQAGLKSSGLGLFIAKGIVDAWGGRIWGESAGVGMGSTFFFTIPIADLVIADKIGEEAEVSRPTVIIDKVAQA